jgi:hypothetical protein
MHESGCKRHPVPPLRRFGTSGVPVMVSPPGHQEALFGCFLQVTATVTSPQIRPAGALSTVGRRWRRVGAPFQSGRRFLRLPADRDRRRHMRFIARNERPAVLRFAEYLQAAPDQPVPKAELVGEAVFHRNLAKARSLQPCSSGVVEVVRVAANGAQPLAILGREPRIAELVVAPQRWPPRRIAKRQVPQQRGSKPSRRPKVSCSRVTHARHFCSNMHIFARSICAPAVLPSGNNMLG